MIDDQTATQMLDAATKYVDAQLAIMNKFGMVKDVTETKRKELIEEIAKITRAQFERRSLAQGDGQYAAAGKT